MYQLHFSVISPDLTNSFSHALLYVRAVEHSLLRRRRSGTAGMQNGGGAFSTGIQDGGGAFSTGIQDGGGAFSAPQT